MSDDTTNNTGAVSDEDRDAAQKTETKAVRAATRSQKAVREAASAEGTIKEPAEKEAAKVAVAREQATVTERRDGAHEQLVEQAPDPAPAPPADLQQVDAYQRSVEETVTGDYREGVISHDGADIVVEPNARVADPYYVPPTGVDQNAANQAQADLVAAIRAERGE